VIVFILYPDTNIYVALNVKCRMANLNVTNYVTPSLQEKEYTWALENGFPTFKIKSVDMLIQYSSSSNLSIIFVDTYLGLKHDVWAYLKLKMQSHIPWEIRNSNPSKSSSTIFMSNITNLLSRPYNILYLPNTVWRTSITNISQLSAPSYLYFLTDRNLEKYVEVWNLDAYKMCRFV
jgi:hypothetical protein